jgi:hypothetical protein
MLKLDNVINQTQATYEGVFLGYNPGHKRIQYPCMMYLEGTEPLKVDNTDEEVEARKNGYDNFTAGALSNRHLINHFWDLEDMSPKQLVVYAREEYGVELPVEAGQVKLFKCLCELTRCSPKNRNRLIMMAHTVAMNYDETLEQIKRTFEKPSPFVEMELETWEIYA